MVSQLSVSLPSASSSHSSRGGSKVELGSLDASSSSASQAESWPPPPLPPPLPPPMPVPPSPAPSTPPAGSSSPSELSAFLIRKSTNIKRLSDCSIILPGSKPPPKMGGAWLAFSQSPSQL